MKRIVIALLSLLALTNCTPLTSSAGTQSWDRVAYVNPSIKPQWGVMKSLEQPGIY
ncbi:MAG: hypothetical protein K2Q12_01045 [Rickettsiales bacterium]|nr:hypothetical protein [Rickettsiales bacterium]